MESKIPKRPNIGLKAMIPTDRIKANATTHKFGFNQTEPYRDLTNLRDINRVGRNRLASPDAKTSTVLQSRTKLRRSRSACDISSLRRPEHTLPLKLPKLIENVEPTTRRIGGGVASSHITNSLTSKVNLGSKSASNVAVARLNNAPTTKAGFSRTAQTTTKKTAKKTTTTNTAVSAKAGAISTSTTGATKPINKRIPPYDFKARYYDLLEKFKSLKEKFEKASEEISNFESLSEQFEECQTELQATKEELKNTKIEKETFRNQAEVFEIKVNALSKDLEETREKLETLEKKHKIMSAKHSELTARNASLEEINQKQAEENEELQKKLLLCSDQLFQSNMERKQLHNALMDLRGNIRVFCRIRPPLPCEMDKPVCGWNYIDEATVEISNYELLNKNKPGGHTFNFDYVFHPGCRQEDIFELVSPLIQSAMDGYNICIFAYGQTGSGKTYTMDGIESNAGVIPRSVDLIFQSIENYKCLGWSYTIKATFLEIYNEVLYDLLSNEQKDMEIRMAKNSKTEIYVSNITEETVLTADHLRELMRIAKMNRATAATVGNERSSRSHAVTRIELIGYHKEKNETSIGTVNLVDLAGSESPKTSLRMNETKNINRSLSELTNVILALLQKQDHIPYRNSKLTHLLMPALGGNSKTLMFINVAPFVDCYTESVKSLRFAASVNSCKVAKAKRNRFLNTSNSSIFSEK